MLVVQLGHLVLTMISENGTMAFFDALLEEEVVRSGEDEPAGCGLLIQDGLQPRDLCNYGIKFQNNMKVISD
jgi:hypothetical protein